ncbi:hypothetical protein [Porcipelethomonas sp.]|uniref:hypothetical protein n=1 Tax=Porcipelethomonas sp. TaxID=2981675 RepID=UPI003EF46A35
MRKSAMIRAVLCVLVIIIVILGWTNIIPSTPGIIISSVMLCVISAWNGIENFQDGRKNIAVFNFIMTAIILFLCIGILIL